jgi:allantoicase
LLNGGKIIGYNNAHYGDVNALLSEGRGKTMGDGWETRRRRVPGNDYIIIELGVPGFISKIEIDTFHFKGNYPDRVSIQSINLSYASKEKDVFEGSLAWDLLLNEQKTLADTIHTYTSKSLLHDNPVSHLRLNIFPDGGVSRLRVYGKSAN